MKKIIALLSLPQIQAAAAYWEIVVRGGEYCFMPGLRALRWLAALDPFST